MDEYIVETITLTETSRLVVRYDQDCRWDSPREWNDAASVHPLRLNSHYDAPLAGIDSHGSAIEEILEWLPLGRYERGYREQRDATIEKHFRRAGIPFLIVDLEADRDWVGEFVWYAEPDSENSEGWTIETLKGEAETYEKWSRGEVYEVELQRATASEIVTKHWDGSLTHHTAQDWETVESIGGCYLEDLTYPAEFVAFEHWESTLTAAEILGMGVKLDAVYRRINEREAAAA